MKDDCGNMFPTFTEGEFICDYHKCYERGNYINILAEFNPPYERYFQFCEWSIKVIFEGQDFQSFIPTEDIIQI